MATSSSDNKRQSTIPFPILTKKPKLTLSSPTVQSITLASSAKQRSTKPTVDSEKSLVPVVDPPQNILDDRRNFCITGSEANAVFGGDRWKTPDDVLFNKIFNYRDPDNENMKHGRTYEPVALKKFEKEFGVPVKRFSESNFLKHPVYPWLGGSLDGVAILPNGERVVIEVKCPLKRGIIKGQFPDYYYIQCQLYLELTGYNTCLFVQYKPEYYTPVRKNFHAEQFDVLAIPRNRGYMVEKLPILKAFWDRLWLYRKYIGKYILGESWKQQLPGQKIVPGTAWQIVRATCNSKLPRDRTRVPRELIELHWIRRFKAAIGMHVGKNEVPYQKVSDLAKILPCYVRTGKKNVK